MADIGYDLGAVLQGFRAALRAASARGTVTPSLGLHDVAMAAGRVGLGGFAPVAGGARRQAVQISSVVPPQAGESSFATSGRNSMREQVGILAARSDAGEAVSYRAVLAQAHVQATAGRARREAERTAMNVPSRGATPAGMSFAPQPAGGGVADTGSLHPAMQGADVIPGLGHRGSVHGAAAIPGLRQRGSVHAALMAAEAGSIKSEAAGSEDFATAPAQAQMRVAPLDIERALEDYFFQQSRLPPAGGAGFNPLLSPVWAGLKIPG